MCEWELRNRDLPAGNQGTQMHASRPRASTSSRCPKPLSSRPCVHKTKRQPDDTPLRPQASKLALHVNANATAPATAAAAARGESAAHELAALGGPDVFLLEPVLLVLGRHPC